MKSANLSEILRGTLDLSCVQARAKSPLLLGVLPGEGIGPEVIQASLDVLSAIRQVSGKEILIETGGLALTFKTL
jgi:hypothetical protein